MFTEFVKDIIAQGYKVNVAVRIAIFPPWKIEDVDGHAAINVGSLAVLAVLYLIARVFTPAGVFGFEIAGIITVFTFVFLVLGGVVINALDPSAATAPKLTNRWSTFLIVSFMYATILVILVSFLPPYFTTGRFNLFDVLAKAFGETGSLVLVAVAAAALAVAFLYWRARRWFAPVLRMRASFLIASLLFCVLINASLLYAFVFAI